MSSVRQNIAIVVVIASIVLSGCGGFAGLGGPSVSNPEVELTNGYPTMTFNYTVDDFSTVLLQAPSGDVVNEVTVEPNQTQASMLLGQPQAGTYTLVVQQGGETKVQKDVSFEGPQLRIEGVETSWSDGILTDANITVENTGDLPSRVSGAQVSANGEQMNSSYFQNYVPSNGTATVNLEASLLTSVISVDEPGPVNLRVSLYADNRTLKTSTQEQFKTPSLTLTDMDTTWEEGNLQKIQFNVSNDARLEGDFAAAATVGGDEFGDVEYTAENGTTSFTYYIEGVYASDYIGSAGGEVPVTMTISGPSGTDSAEQVDTFAGTDTRFTGIDPSFYSVAFRVFKTGVSR